MLVGLRGKARDVALGRTRSEKLAAAQGARPDAPRSAERRLDVRGLRVEELLREVDRFLDGLYTQGEAECVVLHGQRQRRAQAGAPRAPLRFTVRGGLPPGRPP